MMLKSKRVKYFMDRYGQNVKAIAADGTNSGEYRAFVQPVRYKNKMYLNDVESPIGTVSENYYLYIGPADVLLKGLEGRTLIKTAIMDCTVERAENVFLGNEIIYTWAILRKVVEEDE